MPEKVNERNAPFRWTKARIEKLREMKRRGWGDLRIAVNLGDNCTEGAARYAWECLQEFGRVRKGLAGRRYTKRDDEFIRKAYCEDGWLSVDIATAMNRHDGSVRARIHRLGLTRSDTDEIKEKIRERRSGKARETSRKINSFCLKDLWTVRTDRKRVKLYNGQRYEDAAVPPCAPRCGRVG